MKNLKQLFMLVLLMGMCVFASACGNGGNTKVGILITATHGALIDAKDGFVEALKEAGYVEGENTEYTILNPEGDSIQMGAMATQLVRDCDIVLGVGTPAAVALQTARDTEQKDIVVLFTAVTDPVSASLMEDVNKPTNITGTNDMNPVADQVDLILELVPGIKKLGVLYNVSEPNSLVQSNMVKAQAAKKGVEVVVKTVSDVSEISAVTTAMITNDGVEAIYLPTDNLIAANVPAVSAICNEHGIPTVCGESGMVAAGGTITYSINYYALGKLTGEMAAQILNGTPCSQVPSTSVDASGLEVAVNEECIEALGIEIPQSIKDKLNK